MESGTSNLARCQQIAVFFFRSTMNSPEGGGRSPEQCWQGEPEAGPHTAMILFIALPEAKDNINSGVIPTDVSPEAMSFARTRHSLIIEDDSFTTLDFRVV